tara:strand:+ start:54 stop:269 length:216 start_codon:yes stop_codon:yes gene_type:complete
MKYIIFIIIFCLNFNTYSFSNESDCNEYKKFSVNFMKCKANLIKDNAISKSKDFVDDTKSYQKKEWSKEKN